MEDDVLLENADDATKEIMLKMLANVKMNLGKKSKLASEHGLVEGLNREERRKLLKGLKRGRR